MILIIDNFDSFTYNLVDYFQQIGLKTIVKTNDTSIKEIQELNFEAIVISPGPETPDKSGVTNKIIELYHQEIPFLGICLGHQAIGQYFGGHLKKINPPKHGKISKIKNNEDSIFQNLPSNFNVTRYHSLALKSLPYNLICISRSLDDNEIMSFKHEKLPIWGIQFHPEAHLTEYGLKILQNWATINNLIRP